ncbi:MAG: hypothetical protein Q8P41_28955 [Pseudomonadota bacterium]|nr:hypothetical protein [Pseudomonadota bacterium]
MRLVSCSLGSLLLCLVGCATDQTTVTPPVPTGPEPAWPTVIAEEAPPPGYSWQTLRRKTVHARLLVPDDAHVTESDDDAEAPFVRIEHRAVTADVSYSPGSAWSVLGATTTPARVGGVDVDQVRITTDNVTWQTSLPDGGVRVSGYARGARCVVELGPFDRGFIDEAFTICASLRLPPVGPWGPAVAKPSGTAVPTGAWVEPSRAEMVGDSLLGPYAPRIYTGWFGLAHTNCPADFATLGAAGEGEVEVAVTRHDSASGPAYARQARSARDGVAFASGARVVAPRGDGCCVVELFPFLAAPSSAEIDYAVALCDTTGSG